MSHKDNLGRLPALSLKRRTFLRGTSALAAAAALGTNLVRTTPAMAAGFTGAEPDATELSPTVGIHYTVCQMCHGRCGLRVKVAGGVALKIDGNPYHPANLAEDQRFPFATDPATDPVKS
ncbi:MAG: twin-arginine translocation signal domain-containing protein, partial [Candidatus Wallbacteria bacterium]|nr:twin-arginine translocation signal domain-containing protein [Candidatus Wallbacteria bacterium]